jgi:hypothetical protein
MLHEATEITVRGFTEAARRAGGQAGGDRPTTGTEPAVPRDD